MSVVKYYEGDHMHCPCCDCDLSAMCKAIEPLYKIGLQIDLTEIDFICPRCDKTLTTTFQAVDEFRISHYE